MDLAASRPEPIPFFGEMSSTNPVFVLPGALSERGEQIASGLHTSFTLGAGQFCTKPGMVFLPQTAGQTAIKSATAPSNQGSELCVGAILFETDAASFLGTDELAQEVFGPTTLLVQHCQRTELVEIARKLEGHLTATVHATEQDLREYADLISVLESKVGRLVLNGFPTGVEVTHAMVHGGPYPATSDGRSTSVGSQAIFRFARPVCYQGFPDYALPPELKDGNPIGIWRMVDGQMTRDALRSVAVSKAS